MSGIDPDGITSRRQQDPPGQFSSYITSGDPWNESYRLSTFTQFHNSAVLPSELAASGFYYTGFKDRVKCFSCGLNVENWIQGDRATDKRWHLDNCDFANGRETLNKPIAGAFKRWRLTTPLLQNTVTGSSSVSTIRPPVPFSNHNIVNGRNPYHSTPSNVHTNHQIQSIEALTPQTHHEPHPCNSPLNPHMTSVIRRVESFKPRNGIRWPSEKLRASVDELADAGFFFLGERDRVKCFYCNGGLQNWEYEDHPWTEHVKWFPSCEFALRVKGSAFVQNIVNQFPNLDRPTPTRYNPRSNSEPGRDIPPVLSTSAAVEQAMLNMPYVINAVGMGFNVEAIRAVLKRKYDANRTFFSSGEEFMEALLLYRNVNM